jgi:ribose 5-phosphate isomerase B
MKIALGSDHAGVELKEHIKALLKELNIAYEDFGPFSNVSVDYPDFGHKVAQAISNDNFTYGIVICGSGNGINMTVNKYSYIRAALSWNKEIAELARLHNNANILTLPARFVSIKEALEIVKVFLSTDFEGERHEIRVHKIAIKEI